MISTVGVASTHATASPAPSQAIDGTPTASENLATSKSKATPGTIAGTIIGVLIILAIVAFAFWFLRRERRREARRVSRVQAWRRNAAPQMVSTAPAVRSYTDQPIPPTPTNTPPNPYTIRTESRLRFHPEAMVRGADNGPPPPPKELRIPGRHPARSFDGSDSRVGEPIDDSPDPTMPLQPLRLEEKKGLT
ncbi:hypothetical protein C8Q74DRAFT_898675 [Fomes fomentarius]|nr:hypothetical protein C8Q74DRAFT_898675 [Fomes fomentarius]